MCLYRAPIRHIDFSADGNFIMSVDSTFRIRYSEVSSGVEVLSPIVFRDEKWSSWTSPVGWPVQGLWKKYCLDSERLTCAHRSASKSLVAAATNCGRIVIGYNPCFDISGCVTSLGHSGPVSQIGWIAGDSSIISVGQRDHAVFQWKVVYHDTRESGDEGGLSGEDSISKYDGGRLFREPVDRSSSTSRWLPFVSPSSTKYLNEDASNVLRNKVLFEVQFYWRVINL